MDDPMKRPRLRHDDHELAPVTVGDDTHFHCIHCARTLSREGWLYGPRHECRPLRSKHNDGEEPLGWCEICDAWSYEQHVHNDRKMDES